MLELKETAETEEFGYGLARVLKPPHLIFLEGELGVGKTTLVRGFLEGLGYTGAVKSPTFTLVESYSFLGGELHHFDLYRLKNPQELLEIGIRDYFTPNSFVLVEWPEKGEGVLPKPDLTVTLKYPENHTDTRLVCLQK